MLHRVGISSPFGGNSWNGTKRMRVLGLDVGDRRIGVALSDPLGITAQRLTNIQRSTLERDSAAVAVLVTHHAAQAVVVGLPLTMRGTVGEQAKKVMGFIEALRPQVPCPIYTVDERLTTVQGQRSFHETEAPRRTRKQLIDQVAAQLILQAYLDATQAH